ncbi:MAG TPA: P-II family nitrogen regulator [Bacteroidales bacterium]|nr:P-II family nitrogen regulator [Bacteroidales bacterium]
MKKIEVVIRKSKFDEVKEALYDVGVEFITFWDVRGTGKSTQGRVYRGIAYDTSTIERILITFYCREKYMDPAINAILKSAWTGEIGDGKIFISDITDAYRIRTGDRGDKAMYLEGEE